jgi:hypothetical protein
MRLSLSIATVVVAVLIAGGAQALTVNTVVDTTAKTVRIEFTDLPDYEQIRLQAVTALFWCNCADPDNPSSLESTSFTVNGSNLEMKYEGAPPPPPSTNYILYHYLDGYVYTGDETVDWIVITPLGGGGEVTVTGDRPLFAVIPEPSTSLLCAFGLVAMSAQRRSARRAG